MIHLDRHRYEYLEEVNEGVLKQLPVFNGDFESLVLDVGCGCAALSEAIKKKGYSVWGIEQNKEASNIAVKRLKRLIVADLTNLEEIREEIGNVKFDYLVFSDVLEHTYDPLLILKEYLGFLKNGGRVIISFPNVAVWMNRFKLLFGNFNYTDTGVLDRTHIRFFTFRTAKSLLKATGCDLIKVDYTPYMVRSFLPLIKKIMINPGKEDRGTISDSFFYHLYMKTLYPIEYFIGFLFKPFFAFRIILVGEKK